MQLNGEAHELKGKLDFSECRGSVDFPRYSLLVDDCELVRLQVAGGTGCNGETVQQLEDA